MSTEGTLSVRVSVANGRVADVGVVSTRPVRAAHVLSGRAPDDVLRLAPLLFPVCGMAHAVACARAIEAAFGVATDPRLEIARDVACLGEAAVAHVWQLGIAWPEAASVRSDAGAVRAARRELDALCVALFGTPMVAPLRAEPALADAKRAATALASIVNRLAKGEAALLDAVTLAGRPAFGVADTPTVAALDAEATGARLASDPAFAEHPEIDGAPVDVSAYARMHDADDVRPIEAAHGRGLLARLAARRADARAGAERLVARLADVESAALVAAREPGVGVGAAETARGPLVYWVRATPSKVDDVRVVAPTDWTFHPRGVLRRALVGAEARGSLVRDAGWLVLALDPCVPWSIEVQGA